MATKPAQRVLVVDAEPSIVDAVGTRDEGFEVERATTGRAALAAAQQRPPDLIALDVARPRRPGGHAARRPRVAPRLRR
ncbi:MAG: response regulator [Acidimicrobiales bacterium]